jgi:prepilin-type N-terminal cleavage/methylation domain-containing protein
MSIRPRAFGWLNRAAAPRRFHSPAGFTLIEILLAVAILAGIMAAIYSSWMAILRASQTAQKAAIEVQRSRLAVRSLEEALTCAQMSADAPEHFAFVAEIPDEFSRLSFVSRLPESYPKSGKFHGQPMRRVDFSVEPDESGVPTLILRQTPFLFESDLEEQQEPLRLARNVLMFHVDFKGLDTQEWEEEWLLTNQLPRQVRFTLVTGGVGRDTANREDVVSRVVVLPVGTSLIATRGAVQPGSPIRVRPGATNRSAVTPVTAIPRPRQNRPVPTRNR